MRWYPGQTKFMRNIPRVALEELRYDDVTMHLRPWLGFDIPPVHIPALDLVLASDNADAKSLTIITRLEGGHPGRTAGGRVRQKS